MSYDTKISHPIGGKLVQGGLPTSVLNTLQFNAVTNQWEFVAAVAASLSEIEFIRDQIKLGNWFEVTGNISAAAASIGFTPAAGKTLFMYKAKISLQVNMTVPASAITDEIIASFQLNGVEKDKAAIGGQIVGQGANNKVGGYGSTELGRFDVKGLSLIGDGALVARIINIADNGNGAATMSGFIEDT